jgi:asparagine synthase (glutamine-hydrolysing)
MCGIFGGTPGLISKKAERLLHHRGPDQHGTVVVRAPGGAPMVLGQTRLAVVTRAEVPTPLERDGAVIVFNGEVYNFRALRAELEARGRTFQTETDTEVVLVAFLEWGPDALQRMNGMFAFAIWSEGRLFLARDRLGKKPLFYTRRGGGFAFASELKVFEDLELGQVPICEALEFYFDEHSPFANVNSVRPGEWLRFDAASGSVESRIWWTFPAPSCDLVDEKTAVRELLTTLEDACRLRKVADVPVTVFLSGGVDSSLIQAILRCDVTYTVQFAEFERSINERDLVVEFARQAGFEPRIVVPTKAEFLEDFSLLARLIEYPVGSLSVFPLHRLAREARRGGFVVALSGEGADELFNGYYRNEVLLREDAGLGPELDGPYGTLNRRYFGTQVERFCRMASRQGLAGVPRLLEHFAPRWHHDRTFAQNLAFFETTVFLQPLLVMADRLSMGSSLEVRNPFLDHRVVELSTRIDDSLKVRNGRGKWILRRALEELVGPDLGIVTRPVKHGLPAPVNQWLFNKSVFDRRDYNHVLLGECLKELARLHEEEGESP